ncbi:hypothetical protein [Kistimonas asteriae]|uniref:hypothetical protein n=1 Tax=Kistimonas asteriae TaxID=517724 RepID=UPI001BA8354F|nr:hypothetical protein [Kistimonas asteriae]
MENLPAVAGSSGMGKRKLSHDSTPHKAKRMFDFKDKVQLREGIYVGSMEKIRVVSLSPSERERYVPQKVWDSYGIDLKTRILPVFHAKFPGFDKPPDREFHIKILDRIEVCFSQRKKQEDDASTPVAKEESHAGTSVEKESDAVIQLVKKIEDADDFLIECKESKSPSVEVFTCGYLGKPEDLSDKQSYVELPGRGNVATGKVVAVFFSSPAVDQWASAHLAGSAKKCDMQMSFKLPKNTRSSHMSIDTIWLKPGEGAVFQREDMVWKLLYHYRNKPVKFELKTLVYQAPLIADEHAESITISDGEPFLSKEVISTIYQHQCEQDKGASPSDKGGRESLAWKWCTKDSLPVFLNESTKRQRIHFFYHLESHLHTVAVFLFENNNSWVCYIHETLGSENEVARKLRCEIEEALQGVYQDKWIYILYPSLRLQYDYDSCGGIALDAMELIRKKTEGLINDLKAVGISRHKKRGKSKAEIIHVHVGSDQLPIAFMKYFQGKPDILSKWKLKQEVEDGKILRDYLEERSVTLHDPVSNKTLTTNLEPFNRRYDFMNIYKCLVTNVKTQKKISDKQKSKEPIPKKQYTHEQKMQALALRSEGKTWEEVRTQTGVPDYVARHYQKKQPVVGGGSRQPDSGQAVSAVTVSASDSSVVAESTPQTSQSPLILPMPIPIPMPVLAPILVPILIPIPVPVPVPVPVPGPLSAQDREDSSEEQ